MEKGEQEAKDVKDKVAKEGKEVKDKAEKEGKEFKDKAEKEAKKAGEKIKKEARVVKQKSGEWYEQVKEVVLRPGVAGGLAGACKFDIHVPWLHGRR